MIAYGQWEPFTDAAPAREHVRSLQAQGLGWQRIAELAGVAPPTVSSMLYGRAGRPPTVKIRTVTSRALLAFRPALEDLPDTALVSSAGTCRRLQALAAAGWSAQCLAARLGVSKTHVCKIIRGRYPRVTAATARAVRGLYDELWDQPPPGGTRWEKAAASRTRNHARQQGWPPAQAWDDDEIDDPAAAPAPFWDKEPAVPRQPAASPLVAAAIRRARERAELSQRALADAAGVTESYIQLLEYGKRTPSPKTWEQLELTLGPLGIVRDTAPEPEEAGQDAA
jgi:transcriptional regulator with XRE-family HTH domain